MPVGDVDQVHRAAAAPAGARLAAHELGDQPQERAAAGEVVSVAAMCARDVVVRPEGIADAHGDRLLADADVAHRARQAVLEEQLQDSLLGAPDAQHADVQAAQLGGVRRGGEGRRRRGIPGAAGVSG